MSGIMGVDRASSSPCPIASGPLGKARRARGLSRFLRFIGSLGSAGFLVVSLILAALLAGCGESADTRLSESLPGESEPGRERPVVLDMVEDLPAAWVGYETLGSVFDRREEARFTQGWYTLQYVDAQRRAIWSKGPKSVVEIVVLEVKDRKLTLDLAPLDARGKLPHQNIRVFWNDVDLGRFLLGWERQTLEISLPAEAQRPGLNRLVIAPLYWISPIAVGLSFDSRQVGVRLYDFQLSGTGREPANSQERVSAEGNRILQPQNSVIAWHYVLPQSARLKMNLQRGARSNSSGGLWQVVVRAESGAESVVAELAAEEFGERELDIDLADYSGQMAAIQAIFRPYTGGDGEGTIRLERARIEGVEFEQDVLLSLERKPYNVLVVLFDTLRADYLEPYGSQTVKTPALTQFAQRGFSFDQAHANASWTRPSVASLWTGLHPSGHTVLDPNSSLPESVPYLPELFAESGYLTLAVSNNAHFSKEFGFGRGYAHLFDYFAERDSTLVEAPSPEAQAGRVWDRFLAQGFEAQDEKPVFAVLHEIDPHSPYAAPAPYSEMYDFGYSGNVDGWLKEYTEHLLVFKAVNDHGPWLDESAKREIRSLYSAEVSFIDGYFGALLERLEASGQRDRTLVVFLSDHGEQLFDHGIWGHGRSLYQEEVQVPLIFSLPGVLPEGGRSEALVQLADVAPTLLDMMGLAVPETIHGKSLLPEMLGMPAAAGSPPSIYAWSNLLLYDEGTNYYRSKKLTSLRFGEWKLVRTSQRKGQLHHAYELYDLENDPDEKNDRWAERPVAAHTLRQMLESKISLDAKMQFSPVEAEPLDSEVHENLRALGYVE